MSEFGNMPQVKLSKLFLLLFLLFSFDVYAVTNDYSSTYLSCLKQANGAYADTVNCNKEETAVQDKRLNEDYKRYLASIAPRLQRFTIKAQRAWITFRDAECDVEYAIEAPGNNAEVMRTGCILDMTQDRANKFSQAVPPLKP